jgi:cyclopropane-fatty-acyl-phospholipid synthase
MWTRLLEDLLDRLFRRGTLTVRMPNGESRTYGDGTGDPISVAMHDETLPRRIVLNPELAVGEGYMDGTFTIENDDLRGFLAVAIRNVNGTGSIWWREPADAFHRVFRALRQFAPARKSRRNVAHHYDLSSELYDLFLDSDRQYSCAYFADPAMTLEDAQAAKKQHIARKLLIEPGMTVLDIGCGWGGMALTLARDYGARVVGVTLSEEQHRIARARAAAEGLSDKVDFRLTDYRHVTESFDRIVSVGMFEHVGIPQYRTYFRTVHDRLKPDGVALIHTIGRIAPPAATSPWIEKYIFPGGYVPALSEVSSSFQKAQLYLTDIEVWRLHYAETLRHWYERFVANEEKAREIYDERFCRMWRYYLTACEMTFRYGRQAVFQVQLAHDQQAVPLTRDYLHPVPPEARRLAAE